MQGLRREPPDLAPEDQRPHKVRLVAPAASSATHSLPWSPDDVEILSIWNGEHSTPEDGGAEPQRLPPTNSESQAPRTRGAVACQKCRSRKTKCDNQRPSCGYCLKIREPCVYESETKSCCHVFGKEVLQALEEIRELVSKPTTAGSSTNDGQILAGGEDGSSAVPATFAAPEPQLAPSGNHARLKPVISRARIQNIENTVRWRIFRSQIVANDIYPDADPVIPMDHSIPSTEIELLTELELKYVQSVHLVNPILDLSTLRDLILKVAESGFDWSLETCLVALVCAIGAIGEPLKPPERPESAVGSILQDAIGRSNPELAVGYFNVASKRLGLALDQNNLGAVQCLCLTGVWHMHNLQPLQAWKYFSHAANAWFSIVIRNDPLRQLDHIRSGPTGIKEALCFTIWKSSCELRTELSLPRSVLDDYEILNPFPALPDLAVVRLGTASIDSERSWYYYLADIAARHLINDILDCHIYDFDNIQLADVVRMIRNTEILEEQIKQWRSSLPPQLHFDVPTDLTLPELDEWMTTVLRQRYLSSLELTYRPLVRICTDFPLEGIEGYDAPLRSRVAELASRNLHYSYLKILRIRSRLHHGTWFNLRSLTGACLRFAAVERAQRDRKLIGASEIRIPPNWRSCVISRINTLEQYWTSNRGGGAGLLALIDQALAL
ncbi:unnamed protein product [Clonostachys solani]|uniref:Zn(2)-C6 fungal-type domain-containing protein n=1 Tax=Clonostachys solani TaxID=160281 RepID=A0A9N9ZNF9_9HYPO|nr:unnamed protein product [Clonostachys solani]